MSDTLPEMPPEFKPQIPRHLLANLSDTEKWLCECASISKQQNDWLMRRAIKADHRHKEADERMTKIEARLKPFEERWLMLTAKWSVIALIVSAVALPIGLAVFGAWLHAKFGK